MLRIARAHLVYALLASFIASVAWAHVPAASWLMAKMAERRENTGIRRLKVQLACGPDEQTLDRQTLYLKVPRLVRWERSDGTVDICNQERCVRKQAAGRERLPGWRLLQFLYFVEGASTGERWSRLLAALHIDTKVDTLTRAGSRLAVVIGAKEWERDRPQMWLDKDRYLPLRLMVREGESLIDLQWSQWGGRTAGDWFPGRLEVARDGKRIEICTVEHVETGMSISDDLFQVD